MGSVPSGTSLPATGHAELVADALGDGLAEVGSGDGLGDELGDVDGLGKVSVPLTASEPSPVLHVGAELPMS